MRAISVIASVLLLCACGSPRKEAPPAEQPAPAAPVKPADESRRLPQQNLVRSEVVEDDRLGKSFMPGGTLGQYKSGRREFEMFVARTPSANDAALLLLDWKKALTGAKFVAAFGGYFGEDAGAPVFVFAKGSWIAGVKGLAEKDADLQARTLASRLDAQ